MTVLYTLSIFFFFNDTATTEIYTLSLHDALPIYCKRRVHPLPGPSGPQLSDRQPGPPSTPVDAETPAGNTEMLGHWEFASRAAQRFHPATEPIGKGRPPLSVN